MDPSVLLTLMFAAYALPIGVVYFKYRTSDSGSRSISSIITSHEPFFVTTASAPPPPPPQRQPSSYSKPGTSSMRVCS